LSYRGLYVHERFFPKEHENNSRFPGHSLNPPMRPYRIARPGTLAGNV